MKKIIALMLSILLIMTMGIVCPAAEQQSEYLINGDFEFVSSNTKMMNWSIKKAEWGKEFQPISENVAHGSKALKMRAAEGAEQMYISQVVSVTPGAEYTLTFSTKAVAPSKKGIAVAFSYYSVAEDGTKTYIEGIPHKITFEKTGVWEDKKIVFTPTAKDNVNSVTIGLRLYSGGEYHWDNVSLMGPTMPEPEPVPSAELLPAYENAPNVIANSSFEEKGADGGAVNWDPIKHTWEENPYISIDDTVAYEGTSSVKIETTNGGSPWVCQVVRVEPNTTYQVSAWVRQIGVRLNRKSIIFKQEFYTDADNPTSDSYLFESRQSDDLTPSQVKTWMQAECIFTAPEGTEVVKLYCRLTDTAGIVWFDNVEMYPITKTNKLMLDTDQYFYYPSVKTGYAEAKIPAKLVEKYVDGTVDFALFGPDKTTVLLEQKNTAFGEDAAYFEYPISLLSEKKTAYYITATLKDATGAVVDTNELDIYCYDRPSRLDENGNYIVNGEPLKDSMGYHVAYDLHGLASQVGMNLVQIPYSGVATYLKDKSTLMKSLDDLTARGMMGLVCLYPYDCAAGHPRNAETTKVIVTDLIDHPAVYGYAVIDEPCSSIERPEHWLKESYKLIRSLDDVHPVYVLEANYNEIVPIAKLCDVFATDPYPNSMDYRANRPTQYAVNMVQATERYGKGTVVVNQAFTNKGYRPTVPEMRSFWYQTLSNGVHTQGWYDLAGSSKTGIADSPEMIEWLTEFAKEEQDLSYDLFGRMAIATPFNSFENEYYAYKNVVLGEDLYILIFNRMLETQEIKVPLQSRNGLVTAKGTPEEMYLIGDSVNPVINDDSLTATLPAANISLIKISGANIDVAKLAENSFEDLEGYAWAAEIIESVSREDIITGESRKFAPGTPITRGDFAKALIRSLDFSVITSHIEMAEDFADVPADAPYAYEVKIGKTLGILRGTGDNNFNPEAPITRQDLMVICARGMHACLRLGGATTDLTAFPDGSLVADYAKDSVSSMISSKIIQGNADGTLNPLGNTTRAEAAVIMQRIMDI